MIRKETIKKTRDFLNAAKRNLPAINKGHISPQEVAYCHDVSRARFGAAVDMGLFEPVTRRGRGFVYKSTVPYFNEEMAAAVIRHEYNMYAVARPVAPKPAPKPVNNDPHPSEEDVSALRVLRNNGYSGVVFKGNMTVAL
jgi:hypothetical protein